MIKNEINIISQYCFGGSDVRLTINNNKVSDVWFFEHPLAYNVIKKYADEYGGIISKNVFEENYGGDGGAEIYEKLANNKCSDGELQYSIDKLRDKNKCDFFKNKMLSITDANSENIEKIIDETKEHMASLEPEFYPQVVTRQMVASGRIESITKAYIQDLVEKKNHPELKTGVYTGYDAIDEMIGGPMRPGDLSCIMASSGVGKSMMLTNIAREMYYNGYNVVYLSLEMGLEEMAYRLVSSYSGVVYRHLSRQEINDEDEKKLKESTIEFANFENRGDITIFDRSYMGGTGWQEMSRVVENRRKEVGKIDLLIVDYIENVDNNGGGENWVELGKVCDQAKSLGYKLGFPVLTAAQIKRAAVDAAKKNKGGVIDQIKTYDAADIQSSNKISNICGTIIALTFGEINGGRPSSYLAKCVKSRGGGNTSDVFEFPHDLDICYVGDGKIVGETSEYVGDGSPADGPYGISLDDDNDAFDI